VSEIAAGNCDAFNVADFQSTYVLHVTKFQRCARLFELSKAIAMIA